VDYGAAAEAPQVSQALRERSGKAISHWQGPEFAKDKITHISLKAILTHLTHFTQSVHSPGHVRGTLGFEFDLQKGVNGDGQEFRNGCGSRSLVAGGGSGLCPWASRLHELRRLPGRSVLGSDGFGKAGSGHERPSGRRAGHGRCLGPACSDLLCQYGPPRLVWPPVAISRLNTPPTT
jgi:hypothetical protein